MTGLTAAARIAAAVGLVLGMRLACASPTAAQDPVEPVVQPRVEIGGGAGLTWYLPTATVVASVPAASWLAVEGAASALGGHGLAQVQVRMPFASRWRSRRSLVVGLTHVTGGGTFLQRGLGAHVGASFQGALTRRVDVRLDVQQMMPFRDGPGADPRAFMAFVWHVDGAANRRRSPR